MEFNTRESYTIEPIINRNIIFENVTICSFCGGIHNVRDCGDNQLLEFEVICTVIIHHVRNIGEFIVWLYIYIGNSDYADRLKAISIKKCGGREDETVEQTINKFCIYMENTYTMGHDEVVNAEIEAIQQQLDHYEALSRALIQHQEQTASQEVTSKITPLEDVQICVCNICWEEKEKTKFVTYLCKHEFCGECVLSTLKTKQQREKLKCALCRGEVNSVTFYSEETYNEVTQYL